VADSDFKHLLVARIVDHGTGDVLIHKEEDRQREAKNR
jgi:hypothetical protein